MANSNFYYILLALTGPQQSLEAFARQHLAGRTFSLQSVFPMPVELDFEFNSLGEEGYDALYGDWTKLTKRWKFKEAAAQRGYPFPLESREQVIDCIKALGTHADSCLIPGQRYKSNLDQFGFGHASGWRRDNWGIDADVDEVIVEVTPDVIRISFSLFGVPPKKMLALITKPYPDISCQVSYTTDAGHRGRSFLLRKGKEVEKYEASDIDIASSVFGFRQTAGNQWLGEQIPDWCKAVEMAPGGYPTFKGTEIGVNFAVQCVARGEPINKLALRLDSFTAEHGAMLQALCEARTDVEPSIGNIGISRAAFGRSENQ